MPHRRIEIRDRRLRGGRLVISARTTSGPVARKREAAVRRLLELGEIGIIERLRDRKDALRIEDVQRAVESDKLTALRVVTLDGAPALTLGPEVDRVIGTVQATRTAGTLKEYRSILLPAVERFGAATLLKDVSSDQWQAWLHEPKQGRWKAHTAKPWSRARQEVAMALVGRLYNTTIRREAEHADRLGVAPRIAQNPRKNVELATERTHRVEFLRPQEWRALSKAVADRAAHAVVATGTLAGLRIAEIEHLRTGIDVDGLGTDDPVIHVQPRGGQFPWQPKSNRSVRDVPMGAELHAILQRHAELGFAGERYFIRAPGTDRPISTQGLRTWCRLAFTAAGIRYGRQKDALTPHSLRHTFISWLVQRDVSLLKISKLAGTSVDMIIKVYGHLMDRDLRKAVAEIDRVVGG